MSELLAGKSAVWIVDHGSSESQAKQELATKLETLLFKVIKNPSRVADSTKFQL